ncbi:MAG TPA: hypothetical protein VIL44_09245 [Micromonospora sp.]
MRALWSGLWQLTPWGRRQRRVQLLEQVARGEHEAFRAAIRRNLSQGWYVRDPAANRGHW